MTDMMDDFAALKQLHRQQRAERSVRNVLTINASGLTFTYKRAENVYLFRERDGPSCDFYPASGRWKHNSSSPRWHRGGATAFINWYRKRLADDNQKP